MVCLYMADHWWLKPEVSWVWLLAPAGLFTFLYFCLITSKYTYSWTPVCTEDKNAASEGDSNSNDYGNSQLSWSWSFDTVWDGLPSEGDVTLVEWCCLRWASFRRGCDTSRVMLFEMGFLQKAWTWCDTSRVMLFEMGFLQKAWTWCDTSRVMLFEIGFLQKAWTWCDTSKGSSKSSTAQWPFGSWPWNPQGLWSACMLLTMHICRPPMATSSITLVYIYYSNSILRGGRR